ncbi:MAG: methylmalonyl-CoA mutase family protein [Bacteroidales bacterium]|jgi:methylmalonyl-CoA mutase|nr:methylmalonyl-CoA mutase family protein [Bacteroidales bacterium]
MEKKLFSEFPPVSKQQWEEVITADLKGADYDKKLVWKTEEGFSIRPYYVEEDITRLEYLKNFAGKNTAGQPNDWEIRQDFYTGNIAHLASDAVKRGAQSVGISVANVKTATDLSSLLKGIDPAATGIHFTESKSVLETMSFFAEYLKNNKIDSTKVYGSISGCNKDSDKVIMEYGKAFPHFRFIEIKAYRLRNMGCTVSQELGFAIANAVAVLNELTEKGFSIDDVLPRMTLHFATGSNYFIEIAKIRASRVLFNAIAAEYGSKNGAQIFIHSSSSTWSKAVYDPYVNMLRSTTETMSAAIGGADSISTINFDCAYEKADDFSARIARNQQILLKEESFVDKVADPAAGSYYIEHISDAIAEAAWKIFLTVEEKGGYYAARNGYVMPEVEKSAAERLKDVSSRKKFILGVNQYPNLNETMLDKIGDELHASHASGEIEKLRLETEKAVKDGKRKPKVFLLTYGNLAMRKARAGFATNFFGCAGYEIIDNAGFKTGIEGAEAALAAGADITVLCSSDDEYAALVAEAVPALKGKTAVVLAGYPKEQIEEFTAQGVEEFIHIRSNVLNVLTVFNKKLLSA